MVINSDIVSKRIVFWKFYSIWKNKHLKIIQVDEFSVGRGTYANMVWRKCGESGYAIQDAITSRFSVIAGIWNSNLELVAISNSNTNKEMVFYEFMKLLSREIKDRFNIYQAKFVFITNFALRILNLTSHFYY